MRAFVRYIVMALALMTACASLGAQNAVAPYKFDLGAGIGMSGYIGDVNSSNPFRHPGFTGDLRFGYLIDSRWALWNRTDREWRARLSEPSGCR